MLALAMLLNDYEPFVPSRKTHNPTVADAQRLYLLQKPLDTLLIEGRLLRARLELLIAAQQLAIREFCSRRRSKPQDLRKAERFF